MDPNLLRFYTSHIQRYGTRDPRGLGWRDADSQITRFEVLNEIADLTGASVLDEGCGFGDLYPYLAERFPGITYTGIDINADAVAVARERYPAVLFVAADFTEYSGGPFDYVLSSGALTFNMNDAEGVYKGHIRKMYEVCTKGVAFNMLNRSVIVELPDYLGWDMSEVEAYCRTFARQVVLRHDYSTEDFTVYLYR